MKLAELFDLDNPMSVVDDVLSGASNMFKKKNNDNRTTSKSQKQQQNSDNAQWCANPKNKKNPNYKKICK